jgi:hypothetical protein
VSVELYWLLIRVGEGDSADRGDNRTSRGAGHGLDANHMVRNPGTVAGFLPFIERLD